MEMSKQTFQLQGGNTLEVSVTGGKVIKLRCFDPSGTKIDYRKYSLEDLTGIQERSYDRR